MARSRRQGTRRRNRAGAASCWRGSAPVQIKEQFGIFLRGWASLFVFPTIYIRWVAPAHFVRSLAKQLNNSKLASRGRISVRVIAVLTAEAPYRLKNIKSRCETCSLNKCVQDSPPRGALLALRLNQECNTRYHSGLELAVSAP